MNEYCDSLYRPGNDGNLIIHKKKGTPLYVLQGKTRNGFHQTFYELAQSKIRNKALLPKDFLGVLTHHQYFERLENLIHREPFEKMNLGNRIDAFEEEADVNHIWSSAIRETLITRMSQKFPDYPKTPSDLQPPEVIHAEQLERKYLLTEIANATWKNHPNWQRVTKTFEMLRKKYMGLLRKLPIDPDLRNEWTGRIQSIQLVLPGSLPEIVDQDCSGTNTNAFYYPNYNVITVCAGDFNSEDILSTLAHEMSHALDNDRSLYLFFKNSELSKKLGSINQHLCHDRKKSFSCTEWAQFKADSDRDIKALAAFKPAQPELLRCLKKEKTTEKLDSEAINRFAGATVRATIKTLAEEDAFLRLTQAKIPLGNSRKVHNPSLLNPCYFQQEDWSTEELGGELSMLTAFTAEYQCTEISDSAERIRHSVEYMKNLFEKIEASMIQSEGEFSERKMLVEEDYSSSPSERFADFMGSKLMAEALIDHQSEWDRRMTFLAGNSWQCSGPSLAKAFPKETLVLRRYLRDSHTDGDDRKKDIFSKELREVLSCDKDFEWNECSFKQPGSGETP
jgi:hypothetical protein